MQTARPGYVRSVDRAHVLFDHLRKAHGLPNDAALARRASLAAPTVCKIRNGAPVTDTVLVRLHEAFGITFPDMRALLKQHEEQNAATAA